MLYKVNAVPAKTTQTSSSKPGANTKTNTTGVGNVATKTTLSAAANVDNAAKQAAPKTTSRSCPYFAFQREMSSNAIIADSLIDSIIFILSFQEKMNEVISDEEVHQLVSGSPQGKTFQKFLECMQSIHKKSDTNLSGIISGMKAKPTPTERLNEFFGLLCKSIKIALLEQQVSDPSIGSALKLSNIANNFIVGAAENPDCVGQKKLSGLLGCALLKDKCDAMKEPLTNLSSEKLVENLTAAKSTISTYLDSNGFNSAFGQLLYRFGFGELPDDFEGDDLAEKVVEDFRAMMLAQLNTVDGKDYVSKFGRESKFSVLKGTYTLFDPTQKTTVGVLSPQFQMEPNLSRRSITFVLPKGTRFDLQSQAVLSMIEIKGIPIGAEELSHFKYPNVYDGVSKLEQKEAFASADYDWVQVCFSPMSNLFYIRYGEQDNSKGFETQTNAMYFIGYEHKISNINTAIKIPCAKKGQTSSGSYFMKKDSLFDLFVSDNTCAKVKDLLDFLSARLKLNGTISQDLKKEHIKFISLKDPAKVAGPTADNQYLSDLLASIGASKSTEELDYYCELTIKEGAIASKDQTAAITEEQIKVSVKNNNDMIKSNLTNFFDFFFKVTLQGRNWEAFGQVFYDNNIMSHYLPVFLVIDTKEIGSSIVNPKTGLKLIHFEEALKSIGSSYSSQYTLKGLICRTKDNDNEFYPVIVDWKNRTCEGYFNKQIKCRLTDPNDTFISYILLQRNDAEL